MSNEIESGYGYVVSEKELQELIDQRVLNGNSPVGEAILVPGGKKVFDDYGNLIRILPLDGPLNPIEVRVGWQNYRMFYTPPQSFEGDPPVRWQEIENP